LTQTDNTSPLSELIDAVFLLLDIQTLSEIHTHNPSLKFRAATALDIHIKFLTLKLVSVDSTETTPLRCDKTLSKPRYLYYVRFFNDGHFSQGSFQNDSRGGLQLSLSYWFVDSYSIADEDGRVILNMEGYVQSAYLRRLMERVEEKALTERGEKVVDVDAGV
ncbi:hypothetical protein HK097_010147, partial [Rhizophlyctis rosea]